MTSYTVEWNMDGQGYSLFKFGEDLGAEEMFGMAEEIIAGQSKQKIKQLAVHKIDDESLK